jgi:Ig-like domain CHU_C associated
LKKSIFLTVIIIFGLLIKSYSQKSLPNPITPNRPTNNNSAACPLVVTIQDNNPTAECSELVKTLIALTSACTDTTAVTYSWTTSIGGVFSTSRTTTFNLPEFIVATPLTVTVTVVDGAETQTASTTFTVKPRPTRPTLSPIGTIILCDANPITLTSSGCAGGSTPIWNNGNAGLSTISVPAVGGTYFKLACTKAGCVSDSTASVSLVAGIITNAPTVTNRTICEGTSITTGTGLQAIIPNCGDGVTGTYTYAGGLVGYDNGYRSTGSLNPSVTVPATSNVVKKVSVSITWRKQKGGYQNSCGVGDTESYPYHSETQFRIQSPSGRIITLVNTGTYGGVPNPTVTTVFEDAGVPINFYSPPVSGTFAPAEPLSGFIGENASGVWTLLPYDAVGKDPLCVSGFAVTFTQDLGGIVTWWDAQTGGNQVGTGAEFIPTNTTPGVHTYYAQGQCVRGCPSTRTPTTLTINPTPVPPTITANVPSICFGETITLTATGCANGDVVKWNSNISGTAFATGASYSFVPPNPFGYITDNIFTAVCENATLCKSVLSNPVTVQVKHKPVTPFIVGNGSSSPAASVCINSNFTLFNSTAANYINGTSSWTGNLTGNTLIVFVTQNVSYKVATTLNGCTSDSSLAYLITALPRPAAPTVNSSQVQAICIGTGVTLTANGCVGGTIKWTGGLTGANLNLTPTITKTYKAACLSANGCASDSSAALNIVVLPKTKPIITGISSVCGPTATTLTATGCANPSDVVMWRNEITGTTLTETISATKTFRAVCIRNGTCVSDSSDIFTVTFKIKPDQPTLLPLANATVCQGSSVLLTNSTCVGGTLNWTGGITGSSITFNSLGSKTYKVACNVNGCASDSSAAVTINVISNLNMESLASGDWANPATWSCNRIPLASDIITINTNHIINISGAAFAKNIVNNGELTFTDGTANLTLGYNESFSLVKQPDAVEGKDVVITSGNPTANYATFQYLDPYAGTNSGNPVINRGMIAFDFSSIPTTAVIDSAYLSIYFSQELADFMHTFSAIYNGHTGTNSMFVRRITQSWAENTVTWNTQPSITTTNQLSVPNYNTVNQNYRLNVKLLLQDMVTNPSTSFGFMLGLQDETPYKLTCTASSDIANASIRPKIEVYYHVP